VAGEGKRNGKKINERCEGKEKIGPPVMAVSFRAGETLMGYIYKHLTGCLASCPRIKVVDNIFIVLVIQFYAG
jgi:hypothetical protein